PLAAFGRLDHLAIQRFEKFPPPDRAQKLLDLWPRRLVITRHRHLQPLRQNLRVPRLREVKLAIERRQIGRLLRPQKAQPFVRCPQTSIARTVENVGPRLIRARGNRRLEDPLVERDRVRQFPSDKLQKLVRYDALKRKMVEIPAQERVEPLAAD